jgi:hypothetical protein
LSLRSTPLEVRVLWLLREGSLLSFASREPLKHIYRGCNPKALLRRARRVFGLALDEGLIF